MRQMSSRQWDILSCLMADPFSSFTTRQIALKLGVSQRTIRYEVAELADILAERGIRLQRVPRVGISIASADVARVAELMRKVRLGTQTPDTAQVSQVYLSAEQRTWAIIAALLGESCPHTFSELAHALGVSKATISRDMRAVESWFSEHGVSLQLKNPAWYELGISEFLRRHLMVDVIASGAGCYAGLFLAAGSTSFADAATLDRASASLDIFLARKAKRLTDDALTSLSRYLAVSIYRAGQGYALEPLSVGFTSVEAPDYPAIYTLFAEAGLSCGEGSYAEVIRASESLQREAHVFHAMLMAAPQAKVATSDVSRTSFADRITRQLLTAVSIELDFDFFQDRELTDALKVHMQALLVREHLGLQAKCELLGEVQSKFPKQFSACKSVMARIQAGYNLAITPDEIAFIVMYLGAALEHARPRPAIERSVRVALVCGSGVGTTTFLARSLAKEFPHLTIQAKLSARMALDFDFSQTDLILTTIDLARPLPRPTIRVSPMLSRTDIRKIEAHLRPPISCQEEPFVQDVLALVRAHCDIRNEVQLEADLRNLVGATTATSSAALPGLLGLGNLIAEDYIQLGRTCASWADAVALASAPLLDAGFMTEDYYQGILRFASDYQQYGLIIPPLCAPHTEPDPRNRPAISVVTLAHPVSIRMDGQSIPVAIVMVLCLQTPAAHTQALDELFSLIDQYPAFISELLSAKTPAQFSATISNYCQQLKG